MTTQSKIIGRFEPIGEEVGRPRAPFEVLTKEPYEFKGRQGFKGLGLWGAYSVISDHWQFVSAETPGFEPINPRSFHSITQPENV